MSELNEKMQGCIACERNTECQCQNRPIRLPEIEPPKEESRMSELIDLTFPLLYIIEESPSKLFCQPRTASKNVPQLFEALSKYMPNNTSHAIAHLMAIMDDHKFILSRKHPIYLIRALILWGKLPSNFENYDALERYVSNMSHAVAKPLRALAKHYKSWPDGTPGKKVCLLIGQELEKMGFPYR